MSLTQVLAAAKKAGVSFYLEDGKLAFKAPKGAFSASLKSQVIAVKTELVDFLKRAEEAHSGPKVLNVDHVPVSIQQQNQFTLYSRNPESAAYHISLPIKISHAVSAEQLHESLHRLFSKHEAFSTYFEINEQGVEQFVRTPSQWPIFEDENVSNLNLWAKTAFNTPFNLENQLAFRVHITQDEQCNHLVLLVVHHIVFDGWSVGLLAKDFEQCLLSVIEGKERELPTTARLTYLDFSAWQLSEEGARRLSQGINFWMQHLDGAPQHHELPMLANTSSVQGARHERVLRKEISEQIEVLARRFAVTPFVIYHSIFSLVLGRFSNQQDVVVGTPVANRMWPQVESIIGNFVNTIALRTQWQADDKFSDLLELRKAQYQSEMAQQSVPFEEVVRALDITQENGNPLFQVMFSFQNDIGVEKTSDLISSVPFSLEIQTSKFDLQLDVSVANSSYLFSWQYNQNKFRQELISAMWKSFENALEKIIANAEVGISDLMIMPQSQLEQWQTWNNTDTAFPAGTMTELFTHHTHSPELIALSDDSQRINYSAFYQRSCQWGHLLQGYGVAPEKLVAVYLPRSVEMVLALHGVWQAGGAYLPLDISHPAQRIADILEDAQPQCVITTLELAGNLPAQVEVICLDEQSTLDALAQQEKTSPQVTRSASDLAYVIYTSGSTGMPKGVMVEHKALVNRIDWMQRQYPMTTTDVVVQKTPYTFDVSVWELVWPFYVGAELTVAKEQGHKDPQYLSEFMAQQNVSVMHFVPSMLSAMLQHGDLTQVASLKYVFASGEALPSHVVKAFYQTVNSGSLHNLYGPTEAAIDVSYWDCSVADDIVPIGRPIQNIQLHVLDEDLKSLPIGAVGELYISGVGLARGYLNRAELTAERFINSPTNTQEKLYKTGDLVYWREDGQLVYIGRSDFQVKLRGLRIELGEIEAQLLDVAGITEAAVVVQEEQLVAYVVGETNTDVVKEQLAAQLPNFMVPEHYVELEQMPLSANGKLARNALAPISFATLSDVYEAPVGEIEQKVAEIWQQVLRVEQIGRNDQFFKLGGDSISVLKVVSQLRLQGLHLPLEKAYEKLVLKDLAAELESNAGQTKLAAVTGQQALSPLAIWYRAFSGDAFNHFYQSASIKLPTEATKESVETMVGNMLERHDALRLTLADDIHLAQYQEFSQSLLDSVYVPVVDDCADEHEWRETIRTVSTEVKSQWSLAQLCAAKFIHFKNVTLNEQVLVMVVHHIAVDAVSWLVLLQDIEAEMTGLPVSMRTVNYQQFFDIAQSQSVADNIARLEFSDKDVLRWEEKQRIAQSLDLSDKLTALEGLDVEFNQVLTAATLLAYQAITDKVQIEFDIEGHGRDSHATIKDAATVMGWFTDVAVTKLKRSENSQAQNSLSALYALEASSTIENRFNGDYWQHNSQVSVERDVQFNFFGKVSESSNDDAMEGAAFDTGPDISAQFPFLYNLVFSSKLSNSVLKVTTDFNPRHLEREQVTQLISSLPKFIEQVITALDEYSELWPQLQLQAKANLPVEQSVIFSGRTTYLPTSLMQKSMYLDSVANEGQGKYVTQMTLTFKGQLDVSRLQTAVSKVLNKYPSLSAQFTLSDTGELYQSITGTALPKVVYEHTERNLDKHEFDLNEDLMLMMRVENMPDNTANLYLTHHHIILDGWSLGIFVKEVVAAYELSDTYQFESQSQLPYFNWLAQTSTYQARQYWQTQLSQLEAPTLVARNQTQTALAESRLVLSIEQTAKVTDFCKQHGVSINNLLQAVWGFALSKISNQSTVCFGQVVNGRSPELASSNDMVGLFINTLPKVVACDTQSIISDFVRGIHDPEQLNAETLPFSEISKCAPHIAGPLFDSLFVFENFPIEVGDSEKASEDLELVAIEGEESTGFPITFLAVPGDALICKLQLKADIGLSAEALLTLVEHILMEFVSCTNLSDVNALPVEQSQQLQTWNNTDRAYASSTMTELFTHHIHAPESIALSDDSQRINYSAFYQHSCQWGHLLQGYGVAPEKLVALYLPRSVQMVLALHGVWQAGGAYLPLDISHPAQRIADILEDAQPQCVITTRELANNLPEHVEVICLDEQSTLDALAQQDKNSPQVTLSASDLAYVIYTSGSTGMPKGVMVEHKALVNRIDWMQRQYPMTTTDVVVQKTPYTFDVSVWELVWPFYVGAELTVAKEQGHKDPQYLSEFMAQQNVSVMHFVPSMLNAMLQHGDLAQVASLKYVFASGEALPSQVVKAFYQTVNSGSLHNLYGPTEAAIDVSYWDCSAADDIVPIGRPIQNIQLHVLDEGLKPLPIGAVGELYISGVGLARGYLNRAELTDERFINSPFDGQEKFYKTGDLVYWREDGQLVYIGRSDFQVKLRGLRIELGEVEAQLLDVAGITEAAVVVQEEQLVAYVVGEAHTDAVKGQLAAQLPSYMVPEHYVVLEQMPLSANGKLARNALTPISFATSNDVYEAPVGEVEQHIARVWQEVLKLEKVSRYDDFYRLGGHSLLALNVLGQLQRALNIQIPLATVIEFSELKTLAAQIERLNTHVVALRKADENQKVPLTKAQQRMWLVQQLSPQSSEFNMFSALTLRGEINVERIETALRKVQTYHGALRTHLVEQAGEVWQQQMSADLSLTVLDGSLDKAHTMAQVKSLVSQPLSLLNNSPVKVFLLRQSSTQACLVFVVHHMFSDGLSMALIAESFEHFYHAERSQLVEAPFHYSDYALTQSQDERTDAQALAWWREYLKDAPEHHGLMLANPRTAKVSASGNTLTKVLEGSTYQKLSELTSELGISVFHLMHGLISQIVAQYSSDKDVVIGSPMANRVHPDVENMVGLFLDTFVVLHQIDTACSVSQWLKATAENCKEAMRHGQVGFEQIVSELNPNRGHHSPIFQIFINHLKQKEVVRDDTKRDFVISQFELPLELAKYEVSFYVIEGSSGLELGLNYKQDLIEQASAQAYLDALISLIDRVLIDSSQPMSTVLHPSEAHCAANTGDAVNLNHQNLYDWFSASTSEFAHKQALTDESGSVTYQQLDAQVNVIATSLQSRESVAQRVLVYGKRNSAFIGAILACWKIGATAVPIDSDTPIQRAEYIYQDSAADFVLINDATCDFVPSEKQIHLADILSTHSQQSSGESALALQGNTGSSNQVAYLVYTSGSTGKPKGVCGTHTGLINRLQWMHNTYPFVSENNVQITQSGFIRTLWETFLPLMSGNHVHILASDYYQDPESFFNTLNALQVDRIVTTPTVVQSFSQYAKRAGAVLPKLKYWFASGEAMSPEIANEALSSFDDIQFVNLYGSTEVTSDVTHFPLDKNATYQSMRVGQAIANTSVYVVDEQNNKLPALAKGQVAIAGASLAEGYWQRADDSQRAFVQLNGSKERAYLTGDYGVIDQTGQLQLLGRKDDLVNLGGYRCELKEIERAIQRLEHVEDACVIVKDGDTPYLAAYVASSLLSELATQQLTEFLLNAKKELNLWLPYYMLPKSIQVVAKFPVTANGKLDKKALLALSVSSLEESIEATTEVELIVSKVTGDLLNQYKVDLARNFFELGGTSIQAAQLRNSIMSELEINLTLATVFNAVSLKSLAQEIEQQMKSQNLMEHLLAGEEDEADEEFII